MVFRGGGGGWVAVTWWDGFVRMMERLTMEPSHEAWGATAPKSVVEVEPDDRGAVKLSTSDRVQASKHMTAVPPRVKCVI